MKSNKKKRTSKKVRSLLTLVLMEVLAVTLFYGSGSIISWVDTYLAEASFKEAHAAETTAVAEAVSETETTEDETVITTVEPEEVVEAEEKFQPSICIDHAKMSEQNPDYIGWLYAPQIGVDEPIVQGLDNQHYLEYLFDGTANHEGTLFSDERTGKGLDCDYTILYGHNMRNGHRFGQLCSYQSKEFRDENPYIEVLYADGTAHQFEVFCFMQTNINCMEVYDINNVDNYTRYAYAKANSWYDVDVDASSGQLLTLSTCVGMNQPERWVVVAVQVQ